MAPAFVVIVSLVGCGRDAAPPSGAAGQLALAFRTAPREAAAPVLGPVDTIRVALFDALARPVVPEAILPIGRAQTTFEVELDAPSGERLAVDAVAIGGRPISGSPTQTQTDRGVLWRARSSGLAVAAGEETGVELEFTPFVTEFTGIEYDDESGAYTVRWRQLPGAVAWRVTRSLPGGPSTTGTTADTSATSAVAPTYYQVRAVDAHGRLGAPSDFLFIEGGVPAVPGGFLAAVHDEIVYLQWLRPILAVERYDIERSVDGGGFMPWTSLPGDRLATLDEDVQDGFTYQYRIRAARDGAESPFSDPRSVLVPLRPPLDPRADVGRAFITLFWTDYSENESGFEVERRVGATGTFQPLATLGPNSTEFIDSQPPAGAPLQYRIRAVRGPRVSEWSGPVEAQL